MITIDLVAGHHSVTAHTPLADVVVGCACTPGVQRDAAGWAEHLITVLSEKGSAAVPPSAAVDGQEPAGDAGSCHVIPINRNTQ